jgi:hypothetical protein
VRNPARKALYCLVAVIAGAAMVWFGAVRQQRIGEDWSAIVPGLVGFALAPIGFVFLIQTLFAVRGQARLRAGHRVIARWHVCPAEWEQFRRLDARGRPIIRRSSTICGSAGRFRATASASALSPSFFQARLTC